jgi:hypothetical protein
MYVRQVDVADVIGAIVVLYVPASDVETFHLDRFPWGNSPDGWDCI